ncbi:MAG TPA: adenosine-specific kinase [Methanoregulaceae archaeon]|nr:adenosine-specific kinase [Methanoregulaceae archaeon]HPD10149.1 adenosine-specific kinase [Methanoregulaceae archaeon]HRT15155.1 adenosine-specific kinase [Methanoregulaceae archaeon]HRU30728.1 adenosine-specific kinase [Methanoregulaceae archaeon]
MKSLFLGRHRNPIRVYSAKGYILQDRWIIVVPMSDSIIFSRVSIRKPDDVNVILGQSHFIKTAEDLYEVLTGSVPGAKFGLAFCEASADRLVRVEGTADDLAELAAENARAIGAGHSFIIMLRDCYPINVLNAVKGVQEVCNVFCATANPVEVVIAESSLGRGIMGVIDGYPPLGVEGPKDVKNRTDLLRKFGYKRG